MNIQQANSLLSKLEEDDILQNFINQANSKFILLSVNEPIENFPRFTIEDFKINLLAFKYLSVGCSFAEGEQIEKSIQPLETGANLLLYTHSPKSIDKESTNYYMLCAALSFYASFQYSKAFVTLRELEFNPSISNLISTFLKRDFQKLTILINEILLNEEFSENVLLNLNQNIAETRIHTLVIARSLNLVLRYYYTGNDDYLNDAILNLSKILEIAEIDRDPGFWWVIRLFKIILGGIKIASLWKILPNLLSGGNQSILTKFIYTHAFNFPIPIVELFLSQRRVLNKVLDESKKGMVVSIPTSSGKTRIAEIAILQCFMKDPSSKVLYLAPFKSLAYEVEASLGKVFVSLGFEVSQLYGNNQYGQIDEQLIEESQIIIATPEKAKAMIRSKRALMNEIDLIIIDEGHLLGDDSSRLLLNEFFLEELRAYTKGISAKIVLLSAVLPNVDDIAEWLTYDRENYQVDTWRPSSERFGILNWNGRSVDIKWMNEDAERPPFNRNFVSQLEDEDGLVFPQNKCEAVAGVALKLSELGSVLIFVGTKASVMTHARSMLKALGSSPSKFRWKNASLFKAFEHACNEAFGEHSDWYNYATYGILCHNSDLPYEVRIPIEQLMREDKPPFIISTSTLGQGVNIGVSSVIFAQLYQSGTPISTRDFWNIAGRAGRAFIDTEGKILCAIDRSLPSRIDFKPRIRIKDPNRWERDYKVAVNKKNWSIEKEDKLILDYFNKSKIENTKSGILARLRNLFIIAEEAQISKDLLLQLIVDNSYLQASIENEIKIEIDNLFDAADDTLISLDIEYGSEEESDPSIWVDDFFRGTLASIQAQNEDNLDSDDIIRIFKARNLSLLNEVGNDINRWKKIAITGIPYRSSIKLEAKIDSLLSACNTFTSSEQTTIDLILFLKQVEQTVSDLDIIQKNQGKPLDDIEIIDKIRDKWINGESRNYIILLHEDSTDIITKYYSFTLPWVINGIAKLLKSINYEDESRIFEELALLTELGLPNIQAAKFYLTGIRSRSSSTELGNLFTDLNFSNIKEAKEYLLENFESIKLLVSDQTIFWLELLQKNNNLHIKQIKQVPDFVFTKRDDIHKIVQTLIARKFQEKIYLCSLDYNFKINVSSGEIDFSEVADNSSIIFRYIKRIKCWRMNILDPNLKIAIS